MRKVFIVALALLMALVGMSAAVMAEEIVTPLVSGAALNSHVPFSNGFTGFCIDQDLQGASSGMEYVANDMSYAVNQNNDPISEQLKTVLTCFRDDVFEQEDNGGYAYKYHISSLSGLWLFKVFYGFSDNYHIANPEFYKSSQNAVQLINDVKAHVHDSGCPNLSGDAVELLLPDGTLAKYEFKVLVPKADDKKATHQKFFAYKIDYYREMTANEDSAVVFNATINEYAQSGVPEGERYAWEKINSNGTVTPLENTDGLLQLNLVKPSDGGRYRCVVTDKSNCKTNYYFDLTVNGTDVPPANNPPVITYPVQNETVNQTAGEKIELTVEATDADKDDVLTYTWYKKDGSGTPVKVDSANSSKLTIDNCTMDDHNDQYYCEVSDGKSTVTSMTFTLNITAVCVPPVIKNLTVNGSSYADGSEYVAANGESVTLCVKAENANKYQWSVKKAGSADFTDIWTGEDYGPFAAEPKDNGSIYRCTVSNDCDKTGVSISIVLKVLSVDWDGEQPESVIEGTDVTLKVKAENAETYEWYVKKPGESAFVKNDDITGSQYPVGVVTAGDNGTQYYCAAWNDEKNVETSIHTLNVTAAPKSSVSWSDKPNGSVNDQSDVTLTVTAQNVSVLKWFVTDKNGTTEITDAQNQLSYMIDNVGYETHNGSKYVVKGYDDGDNEVACTEEFVLSVKAPVCVPPVIKDLTVNGSNYADGSEYVAANGESVTLCVKAENANKYQWSVKEAGSADFTDIWTGEDYGPFAAAPKDNGSVYRCTVSNDCDKTGVSISIVLKVLSVDWDCERPAGVEEGTEVPLKVKAFNASTYEWYVKRGTQTVLVASGEDATSYTIPASDVIEEKTDSQYICVAKNEDKTAETSAFVLNVLKQADDTPPAFVRPESEVEIPFNAGKTVTLTMPSEDDEFASFAWYGIGGSGESTLFDGENTDTLVIENCAPEYDGAVVVCVAEDEAGNTKSLAFKLVLVPEGEPPVIISPTSDAEISACEGENVTLNIAAENADSYQWYVDKDNDGLMEEIEGAVGTSYTISSVTKGMNGYRYACVAFNDFGFAGSPVFELNVNGVPKMPATGDRSMPFVWLGMMLASAAACVYMLRSRRAE